jgi:hypothetical protein
MMVRIERVPLCVSVLLLVWSVVIPLAAIGQADDTAPMIGGMTAVLARIDTSAIPADDVLEAFGGRTLYVAVDLPFSATQPAIRIYCAEEIPRGIELLRESFAIGISEPTRDGRWVRYDVSLGPNLHRDNQIDKNLLSAERPELFEAIAQTDAAPIAIAVALPDYFKNLFSDLIPRLPGALGGGDTAVLVRDVQWAAILVDPGRPSMTFEIRTISDDAAKKFAQQLPELAAALEYLPEGDRLQRMRTMIRLMPDGDRVRGEGDPTVIGSLLVDAGKQVHEIRARRQQSKRIHQLAIAIHHYHDRYKSFPPSAERRDDTGEPLLSWRVHVLPYLGQEALFREFRLDEPWDSEHNRRLIERMPDMYAWPKVEQGKTVLQASAGERTIFGGNRPVTFRDVTDGTVNTVMLVITKPELAVPWTAPDDYRFDPQRPQDGLQVGGDGKAAVGTADGAAHRIDTARPPQDWLHLFQMNDGNIIRW